MEDQITTSKNASATSPIAPIQRPWLIGLLVAMTFGLYQCFFLYGHARDLKRLGINVRPWLWFISPLLALPAIFTYPKLGDHFERVAKDHGRDTQHIGQAIGIGIFAFTALSNVASKLTFWFAATVICSVVLGVLVARFTRDINEAKRALPAESFTHNEYATTTGLKVALAVVFLLFLPFFALLAHEEIRYMTSAQIDTQKVWPVRGGGFSVATAKKWRLAKTGTYSDGSALVEFGLRDARSVIVFDQKGNSTPDDISVFRRDAFVSEYPDGTCRSRRFLREGSLERRSELLCTASFLGSPVVLMSLSIDDGDRHIELLGQTNTDIHTVQSATTLLREFGAATRLTPEGTDNEV